MADIELVIKIPESLYNFVRSKTSAGNSRNFDDYDMYDVSRRIANGTPLPKGCGRLIDAEAYYESIKKHYFDNPTVMRCTEIALDNAPTIIEVDEEGEK